MPEFTEVWTYLARDPLLWLTLTLAAYAVGDAASRLAKRRPLVNPVLIAVALLALTLWLTHTPYETYFEGAQFVHFMLGPATVAIAVPLVRNIKLVRENFWPMIAALVVGSFSAVVSVLVIGQLFGLPWDVLLAMAPKSATSPVAMGIAEYIGGAPSLTAIMVILTGMLGAVVVTPMMDALGIKDYSARGFSVGLTSAGIGTARAFTVDPVAGTFAGIAMGLSALMTTLSVPLVLGVWKALSG